MLKYPFLRKIILKRHIIGRKWNVKVKENVYLTQYSLEYEKLIIKSI